MFCCRTIYSSNTFTDRRLHERKAIDRFEYIIRRLPDWFIQEKNKETERLTSTYLYEKTKKSTQITIFHPVNKDGLRAESTIKGLVSTERAGQVAYS